VAVVVIVVVVADAATDPTSMTIALGRVSAAESSSPIFDRASLSRSTRGRPPAGRSKRCGRTWHPRRRGIQRSIRPSVTIGNALARGVFDGSVSRCKESARAGKAAKIASGSTAP
jgi:hypothetical protein